MRTFYIMSITQTLSLIGSRMTNIALGIQIFNDTGDATPLLLAAFFTEIPGMLGGSLAGVVADRYDRRRVMMFSDAGSAVATVLLMASFLSGDFQLWHLYITAFIQGMFAQFQEPAVDASITMLVPDKHRNRANAIRQMAFPLAGVVAPVLASGIYLIAGLVGVMIVDLATFLIAIVVIALIHIPRPPQSEEGRDSEGSFWIELRGGFRYLWMRRVLFWLVIFSAFINFMLNGPLELAIPYLITVSGGNEAVAGFLLGIMNLGALTGAVLIAVWGGTQTRIHTMMPALMLTGAMFLIFGMAQSLLLLGAALFVLMIPLPLNSALFISIIQKKTPPDMQGRVFAVSSQLLMLATPLSFLITGPLVDEVLEPAVGSPVWQFVAPLVGNDSGAGMRLVMVVTGLLILIPTVLVYALPAIRHMESNLPDYEALPEDQTMSDFKQEDTLERVL